MKYETPEMTAMTPAINAIQSIGVKPSPNDAADGGGPSNEETGAYADWE